MGWGAKSADIKWGVLTHRMPPMGGKHHVVEVVGKALGINEVTRSGIGTTYERAVDDAKHKIRKEVDRRLKDKARREADRRAKEQRRRK